ncbi:hypothetical protein Hdeb2414_s0007g00246771 [Helianthus debilis subsp. tardiflorus]
MSLVFSLHSNWYVFLSSYVLYFCFCTRACERKLILKANVPFNVESSRTLTFCLLIDIYDVSDRPCPHTSDYAHVIRQTTSLLGSLAK